MEMTPTHQLQAETNGGGLALWGSDGRIGVIRSSDEQYHKSWAPYVEEIMSIIAANQITEGGVRQLRR
jgi:beta-galactosidase